MKSLLLSLFIIASSVAHAEEVPPFGCKPMAISGGTLTRPAGEPSLMMIKNISDTDVWVTHPISELNAKSLSSLLQSKNWSALVLGETAFELSCIESKPGHEQQVPCSGVLVACQWAGLTNPNKQPVPYWAGENMALPGLLANLTEQGFKLPEPPST